MNYCGKVLIDSLVAVTENSNGTLNFPDGTVMSVQVDGSVQTRPSGANGPYELVTVNGLYYEFSPVDGIKYLFSRR
jgi:hypothetical protein